MIKRTPMAAKLRAAWKEFKKDEIETVEPSIAEILETLPDGYYSDLKMAEIPDSAVSEVEEVVQDLELDD